MRSRGIEEFGRVVMGWMGNLLDKIEDRKIGSLTVLYGTCVKCEINGTEFIA